MRLLRHPLTHWVRSVLVSLEALLLFAVVARAPGAESAGQEYISVRLPHGVSIDAPKNWRFEPEMSAKDRTAILKLGFNLSGVKMPEGADAKPVLETRCPADLGYALMRVASIQQGPVNTQENADAADAEALSEFDAESRRTIERIYPTVGLQIEAWEGTKKVKVGDLVAFQTRHIFRPRRTDKKRVVMEQYFVPVKGVGVTLQLTCHESQSATWKPVLDHLLQSLSFANVPAPTQEETFTRYNRLFTESQEEAYRKYPETGLKRGEFHNRIPELDQMMKAAKDPLFDDPGKPLILADRVAAALRKPAPLDWDPSVRKNLKFTTVKLPHGVSMDVPSDWKLVRSEAVKAARVNGAVMDMSLMNLPEGSSKDPVLQALCPMELGFADILLTSIDLDREATQTWTSGLTAQDLGSMSAIIKPTMESLTRSMNAHMERWDGVSVRQIGNVWFELLRYVRLPDAPGRQTDMVDMYTFRMDGVSVMLQFTYRECQAKLWQPVLDLMLQSMRVAPTR